VQFAVVGVAALIVVALVAGSRVRSTSNDESVRDARELALLLSEQIVAPRATPELLAGDPDAIAAMDEVIGDIVANGPVNRFKIWTPDGTIVYSDEHRLIGMQFTLEPEVLATLVTDQPVVDFTDLDAPENLYDEADEQQLEVYLPLRLDDGTILIYEHYQHTSAVDAGADKVTAAFSPVVIRSLIALALLQLPMAWWLARRVRESQRQRMVLLQSALEASDGERRRIAQDLHDGVVQDLAGVSYAIDAVRHDPAVRSSPAVVSTLDRVVDEAQRSIRGLRTLLVDIYPPNLEEGDLAGALGDLLTPFEARGVRTEFRDEITGEASSAANAMIYRTAREALRNVESHAEASSVQVRLRDHQTDGVELQVIDDGKGFDAARLEEQQADGHFGVRLLADVARAAGGELTIVSSPGAGTRVTLVVPR
jgi:signal transduction histidine kinase